MGLNLDKIKQEFPFLTELNSADVLDFLNHLKEIRLNPGEVFLEEGSLKSNVYFIKKGLIRSFYIDEKGQEITNRLRYENQIIASYEIIFFNQPSRFIFQTMEESELLAIDFHEMRKIVERNQNLESGRRYFVSNILAESLKTLDDFILLSPEERYIKFVNEHPNLLNRVPIKYIANVLGITPVSLSRIRKRVANKKH